jgi:hypothetical protein
VNRVILGYWKEAELYYRKPDGTPPNTIGNVHIALSCLRALYGNTPAAQFGPSPPITRRWVMCHLLVCSFVCASTAAAGSCTSGEPVRVDRSSATRWVCC